MDAPHPKPAKFQWPPRAVDGSTDALAQERAPAIARREAARPATKDRPPPPPYSWWAQVERSFFGVVRGTWAQRTADVSWEPDQRSDYCARCGQTVGMFAEVPAPVAHRRDASATIHATATANAACSCAACARADVPWERVVRMGAYTGVLREALLEVKFAAWRRLGADVGAQFGPVVAAALREHGVDPASALIVPIPSSMWRRMARGIDHSVTLARAVSSASGVPFAPMLHRLHRPPQTGRTLDQRRRNVVRTMSVARGWESDVEAPHMAGRTILLVDDVMTSGATMREACRAIAHWLREQGGSANGARVRVWVCPLAVTDALEPDGAAGHLKA